MYDRENEITNSVKRERCSDVHFVSFFGRDLLAHLSKIVSTQTQLKKKQNLRQDIVLFLSSHARLRPLLQSILTCLSCYVWNVVYVHNL